MVSIIIPVFNVEKYIKSCLDSVSRQTYKDLEVILVDDCSSDNSFQIIQDYIESYKGPIIFKAFRQSKNMGPSAARNTGLDYASGDYISFIDGDDYVADNMYERFLQLFDGADESIKIISACCYSDRGGVIVSDFWSPTQSYIIEPEDYLRQMLTKKSPHIACGKLFKREIFNEIRFRNGKKNEDTLFCWDFYPIVEREGIRTLVIPERLYYYRQHENSITTSLSSLVAFSIIENLEDIISGLSKEENRKDLLENQTAEYVCTCLTTAVYCAKSGRYDDYMWCANRIKKITFQDAWRALDIAAFRTFLIIRLQSKLYYQLKSRLQCI